MGVIISLVLSGNYVLGFIALFVGLYLVYFYFQNYRFAGVESAGLLRRDTRIDYFSLVYILFVVAGILFNLVFVLFLLDVYG